MTGDSPVLDRPALRAALSDMQIDLPEPGVRFDSALAMRNGWNIRFAERVADEYRRFLYLAATAGYEVTPSRFVDEAWHLHLALPHYREILCARILGRPLEHRPGTGTPEDEARCQRQYEETLALYERVFVEPAPLDVWPRPVAPGEEREDRWWEDGQVIGGGAAVLSFFAGLWAYLSGAAEIGLVLVLVGVIIGIVTFRERRGRRHRGGGGDCGGSCGGGSDGDGSDGGDSDGGGSDGGSSCGSSCGGGGCSGS